MPDTDYHQLLQDKAAAIGGKTLLLFEGERVTYAEMDRRANRVANGLIKLGAGPGVSVANMLPNSPETLYAHFAIQKAGACSVPVNTELKGDHLAHVLHHSDSRILFIHHSLLPAYEKVKEDAPAIEHVVVSQEGSSAGAAPASGFHSLEQWLENESEEKPKQGPARGDPSTIAYTSGTTGRAKGVVYRYGKLGLDRIGLMSKVLYTPGDVIYTCLPLFHINALYVSLPAAMWTGTTLALGRRFSASRFWDEIRSARATTFNALGAMIPILMKQPEREDDADNPVRMVLSAACPAGVWRRFEQRFGLKIIEFYGAADGGGNAIFNFGNAPVGSIGRLARGSAMVVDDDMNEVPPGVAGELVFRLPDNRKVVEYYKNEEAEREKQRDGWLHTGDLVYRDEDDFLYFVDRKSDNMRRRGENIASFEVESVVERFEPVLSAAAYAIKSELGEDDVMVAVAPRPGMRVDPAELYDFCVREMPRYMIPRYIRVVESLQKTETHRVIKSVLKKEGVTPDTWDEERERGRRK